MNVYVLRHGKAEEAIGGMKDADRSLTDEGVESLKEELPGMKELIGQLDFILMSPMRRAVQTAHHTGEYFKCFHLMDVLDALAAPAGEDAVIKKLNSLIGKENVMVVGHMPYLAELILRMVKKGSAKDDDVDLKKGGLAKVSYKGFIVPHEGKLEWVKTPKEMKKMGK